MALLAQQGGPPPVQIVTVLAVFVALFFGVAMLVVFIKYFRLWIQSKTTGAGIGIFDLLGMSFRKVDARVIVAQQRSWPSRQAWRT